MHDRYMGTPAPNLLVLSRAGAAIARVSSGKPKKSRECALRDTNAAEVRSVHAQTGSCAVEAARRRLRGAYAAAPSVPGTSTRTPGVGCMHPAAWALSAP